MKKNYIKLLSITLFITIILLNGCSKKGDTEKVDDIKPNQSVSSITFYVPDDYKVRNDLRGLIYTDETRKVFAKGETSDYSTFYTIDMLRENSNNQKISEFINNVNSNNLKEADVKFNKYNNDKLEVYGREGYINKSNGVERANYAYYTQIDTYFYVVTISGPKNNQQEIEKLAKQVANSLQK